VKLQAVCVDKNQRQQPLVLLHFIQCFSTAVQVISMFIMRTLGAAFGVIHNY